MERLPPGLIAVAWREVQWIWRDRVALLLVAGVPLLAFALLSLTFSNAVVRDLKVDVVDADNASLGGLVPGGECGPWCGGDTPVDGSNGAMQAVRSGDAIAAVYVRATSSATSRRASGRRS